MEISKLVKNVSEMKDLFKSSHFDVIWSKSVKDFKIIEGRRHFEYLIRF